MIDDRFAKVAGAKRERPRRRRPLIAAFHVLGAGLLAACSSMGDAPVPMRSLTIAPAEHGSPCTIVFLHGRGGDPTEFISAEFPKLVRTRGLTPDMVAPYAPMAYYANQTVIDRLASDVVAPAHARGAQKVWLVGVSMGGLGSLVYTSKHPDQVAGVLALAPYLGPAGVINEIRNGGGLKTWQPPEGVAADAPIHELWRFLQRYANDEKGLPPIYLGYGTSDSLAPADELLGAALAPDHVFTTHGHHTWSAWRRLWEAFLATGALDRACS